MDDKSKIIQIDVDAVLRQRLPRYYRFIPRAVVRWLERTVCQDTLNELLRSNFGKTGAEFCRGVLEDMDVTYTLHGEPPTSNPRVLFVSNHPLGGLDGMILIDVITSLFGRPVHFVVNDLLMAVVPLRDVFLPINKHGAQSRYATLTLDQAFEGDDPILMFPAGLVSRRGKEGIKDLAWNKMFVNKAIQTRRDIIPIHFSGRNSDFFYNFAHWRERLGLRFNVEMIYLPSELVKARGRSFDIRFGKPIPWESLRGGREAPEEAALIRRSVYNL